VWQRFCLVGRVGKDPYNRSLPTERSTPITNFPVVVNERIRKKGVLYETKEWFPVVTLGRLALLAERRVRKGMTLLVEGKLRTRKWVDTETGITHYRMELICSNFEIIKGTTAMPIYSDETPETPKKHDTY
jgi:single-strand DNA-binding protein